MLNTTLEPLTTRTTHVGLDETHHEVMIRDGPSPSASSGLSLDMLDSDAEPSALAKRCAWMPPRVQKLLALLVMAGIVLLLYFTVLPHLPAFFDAVQSLGPWGYVIMFFGIVVCGVPPVLFYLAFEISTGLIFHHNFASAYFTVVGGGAVGAIVGYAVGYVFRSRVLKTIAEKRKLQLAVHMLQKNAFKFLFLFRLSFIPFSLLNAVCGATHLRFSTYALASLPSMMIQQLLAVWLGSSLSGLTKVAGHSEMTSSPVGVTLVVVEVSVSVLLMIAIAFVVKRAIERAEQAECPIALLSPTPVPLLSAMDAHDGEVGADKPESMELSSSSTEHQSHRAVSPDNNNSNNSNVAYHLI